MPERICVVGAGASGLTAKTCLENGLQVVCFEKFSDIDGLWRYKPTLSWYRDEKHDNQSRMTAFSDFVPPPEMPNFMSHPQMLAYFRSYADHFHLLQHIRLSHEVRHIERDEKYEETGRWSVTCCVIDDNTTQTEKFEGILLCCGHHTIPYWPEPFSGQDKFRGEIIHSHDYREPFSYIDKTVVLIGIGNSSGDIARATVYISIRSGTWVIGRTWDKGEPIDLVFVSRCMQTVTKIVPSWLVNKSYEKKLNLQFDHGRYGLKPKHQALAQHATINDELPGRIACGTVIIKPNVARFTEHDVIFEDGTAVCNVDAVIFGTGYSFQFPIVEDGNLIPVTDNKVDLYLHIFPLQLSPKNTLAVIGLIQPIGSIMPVSEMQSRFYCEVFAGHCKLPAIDKMKKDVERRRVQTEKRFLKSRRHTLEVDYATYMDELAKMVGVKPNLLKYWFTDPRLAYILLFEGLAPYQFRLNGPHAWVGARDALLGMARRTFENSRTRQTAETMKSKPINKFLYYLNMMKS
uniref:Flavin-containing monooxygenase n=1 Tax=Wuchereria bancrofti TaxID=6293 RepID=A0AAF5PK86_WUCBA